MAMDIQWTNWLRLPWLQSSDVTATTAHTCDRLLADLLTTTGPDEFLKNRLPDMAAECGARWIALLRRDSDWNVEAQWGRCPEEWLQRGLFEDALHEDAAGLQSASSSGGDAWIATPIQAAGAASRLLVLAGRAFSQETLHVAMVLGRVLGYCLAESRQRSQALNRIARLRGILDITAALSGATETETLLEAIADRATSLLQCDRTSIFLWDRDKAELIACPALGVEGKTLRLPDRTGIVGQVIRTGKTIRVDDAYRDSRFDQGVDQKSGYTTRTILCVPMHNGEGELIGAFQALNKTDGIFTEDDEESLRLLGNQAAVALKNTREREQLIRSHQQMTAQFAKGVNLIGVSPPITALRETIGRLAATDLPVLLLGESGTGKDVVAQALHYQGTRADRPFVAVNCAALTETLLESELFGHERGAFTDAHETRKGTFELAEGGTLFLDEIGDMSPGGQAKLLRVLEQKVMTRVGGTQPIPTDVRVIAATNSNLGDAVRARKFREDLFYRLSVVTLDLPPLRDRTDDVIPLAEFFLDQFSVAAHRRVPSISNAAAQRLRAHRWPGNVRELRNLMERLAFLCPREQIEVDDLAFILIPNADETADIWADRGLTEATRLFQQEFIRRAIDRRNGNMSDAARSLGLHRSNLYRKMHHLDMPTTATGEDSA